MQKLLKQCENGEAWIVCDHEDDTSVSSVGWSGDDSESSSDDDSTVSYDGLKVETLRKNLALIQRKLDMKETQPRAKLSDNSLGGSNQSLMSRWDDSMENCTNASKRNEQWSVNAIKASGNLKGLSTGRQTARRKPATRPYGSSPNLTAYPISPIANPSLRRTGTDTSLNKNRSTSQNDLPGLRRCHTSNSSPLLSRANQRVPRRNRCRTSRADQDILELKAPSKVHVQPSQEKETLQPLGPRGSSNPNLPKAVSVATASAGPQPRAPSRVVDLTEGGVRGGSSPNPVPSRVVHLNGLCNDGSRSLPRLNDSSSSLNKLARSIDSQGKLSPRGGKCETSPRCVRRTLQKAGSTKRLNNSSSSLNRLVRGNEIQRKHSSGKLGEATQARIYQSLSGSSLNLLKNHKPTVLTNDPNGQQVRERFPTTGRKKLFEKFTTDMHSFLVQNNNSGLSQVGSSSGVAA